METAAEIGVLKCEFSVFLTEIPRRGHAPILNEPASIAAIDLFLSQIYIY